MIKVWNANGNETYYNYAKTYADKFIDKDGVISQYKVDDYNIDAVNSGKFLFDLYEKTKDERYLKAINQLRDQLKTHPRTSEGGFCTKNVTHTKCGSMDCTWGLHFMPNMLYISTNLIFLTMWLSSLF